MALDICRELMNHPGHEVVLLCLRNDNEYSLLSDNLPLQRVGASVIPSVTGKHRVNIEEWLHFIRHFQPEVIHSHLFEAELVSRWVTFQNIRYFTHCHDSMHQLKRPGAGTLLSKSALTDAYERRLMIGRYRSCNNHFLAISHDTKEYFETNLPSDCGPVSLFPNAINLQRFHFSRINAPGPGQALQLVNTGSFVDKKNQRFLIELMEWLVQKDSNVILHLIGDGENRESLIKRRDELHLNDRVIFHGKVDRVEEILRKADVYVHSATEESFGLVLLEAMAAGLPVVCLETAGSHMLIRQGENGYAFAQQDVESFGKCILELRDQPEHYLKMSMKANETAMAYSMTDYVKKLLTLYAAG
jgi:glycosyltransferase involved in cell wall biosynthesis